MNKKIYVYSIQSVLRKAYVLLLLITLLIATNWLNQNTQAQEHLTTMGTVVLPEDVGLISGRVFHDIDGDAVYDESAGDFSLGYVEVWLTYPDGAGEAQTTGSNGMYEFNNLPLGQYRVTVDWNTLPNCKDSTPTFIKNLEPDEDPDPYVTLTSDYSQQLDYDFGYELSSACSTEVSGVGQETNVPTSVHILETTNDMNMDSLSKIGVFVFTLLLLTQMVVQPVTDKN